MYNKIAIKTLLVTAVLVAVLHVGIESARAVNFTLFELKTTQFVFNLQNLKKINAFWGYNVNLARQQFLLQPKLTGDCEREYLRCKGKINQFDDTMEYVLLQAKNVCINSGKGVVASCFGLNIAEPEYKDPYQQTVEIQDVPENLSCPAPDTRSCITVTGLPGSQKGICDSATGEYSWGECKSNLIFTLCQGEKPTCPIGQVGDYTCQEGEWIGSCSPITLTCSNNQPQCPIGNLGAYTCQNGQWVNNCYLPTCSGSAPSCPSGYGGFYVCQNGQWVNQCQASSCTSFSYSSWSACANGVQTRTVLSSSPAGCQGGQPILTQECCSGAQPTCPAGWTGSYVCGNNYWYNACIPPGPDYCYRGVKYRLYEGKTYAKCVGRSQQKIIDGQSCYAYLSTCPAPDYWGGYGDEYIFKMYVDAMYSTHIPDSCDIRFRYTQC